MICNFLSCIFWKNIKPTFTQKTFDAQMLSDAKKKNDTETNLLTQKQTYLHKNTYDPKTDLLKQNKFSHKNLTFATKTDLNFCHKNWLKLLPQKLTLNLSQKLAFFFLFTQKRTCSTQRGSSDARPLGWRGATQRSEHSTVPSSLHSQADSEIFVQKKIIFLFRI